MNVKQTKINAKVQTKGESENWGKSYFLPIFNISGDQHADLEFHLPKYSGIIMAYLIFLNIRITEHIKLNSCGIEIIYTRYNLPKTISSVL